MPQSLDNWPAIIIALFAAVAAFLVPFTSFLKTVLDYRLEERKAENLKPEIARDVAGIGGTALFDSMALTDLTAAVKGLTAAIQAETASEEAQHSSRLASAIDRFTEAADRFESGRGHTSRPHR